MSDTFDHCLDAFECRRTEDEGPSYSSASDPLFYHSKVEASKVEAYTEKCYKVTVQGKDLYIAKSLCRNVNMRHNTLYVHTRTLISILQAASIS